MSTSWTYLLADVVTNEVLCEVPLKVDSVSLQLNKPSELSGTMPVRGVPDDPYRYTTPGRTCVYVLKDGQPWWGGIIWTRGYRDGQVSIGAGDWWSYYNKRYLILDKTGKSVAPAPGGALVVPNDGQLVFTGADQVQVVHRLIELASAVPGGSGDLKLKIIDPPSNAVTRTITYPNVDMKPVGSMLTEMSGLVDGPDLLFGVQGWDASGTAPQRVLWVGGPDLTHGAYGIVWEYGGNMLSYTWQSDGSEFATRVWLKGPGSGSVTQIAGADNITCLGDGWPLIEYEAGTEDSLTPAQLRAAAEAERELRCMPQVSPTMVIRTDRPPHLNFMPGDHAMMVIRDAYFRDEMVVPVRVVTLTASMETDTATIVVNSLVEDDIS